MEDKLETDAFLPPMSASRKPLSPAREHISPELEPMPIPMKVVTFDNETLPTAVRDLSSDFQVEATPKPRRTLPPPPSPVPRSTHAPKPNPKFQGSD
jgi:hypothetical protein